ncbi:MAG: LysE family transporter [Pseudomonadota bacterium]
MAFDTWLLFLGTVLLFMCTPGPSHLLMLSASMAHGFGKSLATAAGDLTANTIQILLAGLGLAAVLAASRYGFLIVKWAGVAYLVWLGSRQIIASFRAKGTPTNGREVSSRRLWLRGFLTSAANPKAVVFFAALFPQFLNPDRPLAPQLAILGFSYIVIDACFLAAYGAGASWIARKFQAQFKAWVERAAGASLIAAAILLGLRSSARE